MCKSKTIFDRLKNGWNLQAVISFDIILLNYVNA